MDTLDKCDFGCYNKASNRPDLWSDAATVDSARRKIMGLRGYLYVYEKLLLEIELGHYPPGSALPPENELAGLFHVSRTTLRKALARLGEEGFIVSRHGSGNFVSMPWSQQEQSRELHIGIEVNGCSTRPFLSRTLEECQRAGSRHGVNLVLRSTGELYESDDLDGAIFPLVADGDFKKVAALAARRPVVLLNRMSDIPALSYVAVNYAETVFRVINRLLLNGARRIAAIGGTRNPRSYALYIREIGFRRAFAAHHLTVDESLMLPIEHALEFSRITQLLLEGRPEVIFVHSETSLPALFAAIEAERAKLAQPVYLICFDDIQNYDVQGRFLLSGIGMPFGAMAEAAVSHLADRCRNSGNAVIKKTFLPCIMVNDCPFLI